MKTFRVLTVVIALMALYSCGEKKQADEEQVVRVKVQELHAEPVHGEQGFSGTIQESSGASLSFLVSGTIQRIYVNEGQNVSKGQLIAELDPTTLTNAHIIAMTALEQAQDTYKRMKALYDEDEACTLRVSSDNPQIQKLYSDFLEKPGSELAEELLHTSYTPKEKFHIFD